MKTIYAYVVAVLLLVGASAPAVANAQWYGGGYGYYPQYGGYPMYNTFAQPMYGGFQGGGYWGGYAGPRIQDSYSSSYYAPRYVTQGYCVPGAGDRGSFFSVSSFCMY